MATEGEEGDIDLRNDETFGDGAVGEEERERESESEKERLGKRVYVYMCVHARGKNTMGLQVGSFINVHVWCFYNILVIQNNLYLCASFRI